MPLLRMGHELQKYKHGISRNKTFAHAMPWYHARQLQQGRLVFIFETKLSARIRTRSCRPVTPAENMCACMRIHERKAQSLRSHWRFDVPLVEFPSRLEPYISEGQTRCPCEIAKMYFGIGVLQPLCYFCSHISPGHFITDGSFVLRVTGLGSLGSPLYSFVSTHATRLTRWLQSCITCILAAIV